MLGVGVILHSLSGGSPESVDKYYGRTIIAALITDEELRLQFNDGVSIRLWDNGQSCCESRYMRTDDDVQSLVGAKLLKIEAKDGPSIDGDYDYHEQVFVEVQTDRGLITIANHNEHNGYYGGFSLSIAEIKQ